MEITDQRETSLLMSAGVLFGEELDQRLHVRRGRLGLHVRRAPRVTVVLRRQGAQKKDAHTPLLVCRVPLE